MAGRLGLVSSFAACRCQKGQKTRTHEFTLLGIGRSTVLSGVTGEFYNVSRVHHFADMHRVIRTGTHAHARGMRGGHRRHYGDRKYGKHGD